MFDTVCVVMIILDFARGRNFAVLLVDYRAKFGRVKREGSCGWSLRWYQYMFTYTKLAYLRLP